MAEIPTRDEFEALVGCVTEGGHADFDAMMAVYDAQVKCIAELKKDDAAEADEFNAGFSAYENAEPVEAEPDSTPYDQWRMGWAWAAFEPMRKRVAELEKALGLEDNDDRLAHYWQTECAVEQ